jgi:hypothetical protein
MGFVNQINLKFLFVMQFVLPVQMLLDLDHGLFQQDYDKFWAKEKITSFSLTLQDLHTTIIDLASLQIVLLVPMLLASMFIVVARLSSNILVGKIWYKLNS